MWLVSVLAIDGMFYSKCTLNTNLQVKAVTISTSKTITICSLYLPSRDNLNIALLTRLIDQLTTPFIPDSFNLITMYVYLMIFFSLLSEHPYVD